MNGTNNLSNGVNPITSSVNLATAGSNVAASLASYMAKREAQKEQERKDNALKKKLDPETKREQELDVHIGEVLLVLMVLGQRLLVLEVVEVRELMVAREAVRQAFQTIDSKFLLSFENYLDDSLQFAVTSAMFFCAACYPMHIYRGFGTGVLDDFLWGCPDPRYVLRVPKIRIEVCAMTDRSIAFLKSMPCDVQLLTKMPSAMSREMPIYTKKERHLRKKELEFLEDKAKAYEKNGYPPPMDGSFNVLEWHVPFATWSSPYTFENQGHSWKKVAKRQLDPGRLMHAFTVGSHLDLKEGEVMLLLPGPGVQLLRWLEGLATTTFKLLPETAFNTGQIKFSRSTRRGIEKHYLESVVAVRDPLAHERIRQRRLAQRQLVQSPRSTNSGISPNYSPTTGKPYQLAYETSEPNSGTTSFSQNHMRQASSSSFSGKPYQLAYENPEPSSATSSFSQDHIRQASSSSFPGQHRPMPEPPAPPSYPALCQVVAMFDFRSEHELELAFSAGDILDVLDDSEVGGWWDARLNGRTGKIPSTYVNAIASPHLFAKNQV